MFPGAIETSLAVAARDGTTVTGSGTANTKGTWAELIASTGADAEGIWVMVHGISAFSTDTSVLLDIGTGAEEAEVVLIPDLDFGYAPTDGSDPEGGRVYFIPVAIASGTRIAARLQGAVTTETAQVSVFLAQSIQHLTGASAVEAIGENAADSTGVAVVSGSGAWGSWTSIGTISADRNLLHVGIDADGATTIGGGEADGSLIQLGFGASAPDAGGTAIEAVLSFHAGTGEQIRGPFPATPVYADLTSGETIWARIASGGATYGVVVHAMEAPAAAGGGGGIKMVGRGGGLVG